LRTPLTQVRGYADILGEIVGQDQINKPFMSKVAGNIRKATDRLEAIYSAMIDVSAIGVDALQLHFDAVLPMIFVFQAVEKWRDALQERSQTLEMNGIEDLPHIQGDSERLVQAFSNLINNAIKFTPDGGRIEVWGRVVKGAEEVLEIIVADTGIGIDPADHDMIFEKFYRVGSADLHSTGTTKFKGAGPGLGLPIAKGVVEGHKGRIWVESQGHNEETCPGSRFHVLLPLTISIPDPVVVTEQLKKSRPVTGLAQRLASQPDE
jgi:signal transduction histidine kinase